MIPEREPSMKKVGKSLKWLVQIILSIKLTFLLMIQQKNIPLAGKSQKRSQIQIVLRHLQNLTTVS